MRGAASLPAPRPTAPAPAAAHLRCNLRGDQGLGVVAHLLQIAGLGAEGQAGQGQGGRQQQNAGVHGGSHQVGLRGVGCRGGFAAFRWAPEATGCCNWAVAGPAAPPPRLARTHTAPRRLQARGPHDRALFRTDVGLHAPGRTWVGVGGCSAFDSRSSARGWGECKAEGPCSGGAPEAKGEQRRHRCRPAEGVRAPSPTSLTGRSAAPGQDGGAARRRPPIGPNLHLEQIPAARWWCNRAWARGRRHMQSSGAAPRAWCGAGPSSRLASPSSV